MSVKKMIGISSPPVPKDECCLSCRQCVFLGCLGELMEREQLSIDL